MSDRSRKSWSADDVETLENSWGSISVSGIASKLGRSVSAVKQKAGRLGLGDAILHYDGISLLQLSEVLGVSYSVLRGWVVKYGFPVRYKRFAEEMKVAVVNYDEFWEWAEANKEMIDFSRMDENILGPEKEWVKVKRDADNMKKLFVKKSHNVDWTEDEDRLLRSMVNAFRYTYPEIAARLKRSQGAVKRRLLDIGVQARPIRLNNHIKYTDEDVKILLELVGQGYSMEDIGHRLNKSALGVRGKLERLGYKFRNGVPYKEEKLA